MGKSRLFLCYSKIDQPIIFDFHSPDQKMSADESDAGGVSKAKRRFADITNLELEKIIEEKDAKNTRRSTDQAVRMFRKYLEEKELDPAFENYDPQTLDKILCKFYAEARTTDGELYKKSSLTTTRHGINRYLGNASEKIHNQE